MTASTPRRILHIKQGEWRTGGVETFVMAMLEKIDRTEVLFDVLTIVHQEDESPHDARLYELGGRRFICVEERQGVSFSKLAPLMAIYGLIRRNLYATVHIHTGSPLHALYALAARAAGARTVIIHSHVTQRRELGWPMGFLTDRALSAFPTHWFACSHDAARALFPERLLPRVDVVRNAINVESFRFDGQHRALLRKELDLPSGHLSVIHVGRFSWEKNHALLLRAFKELIDLNPEVAPELILVGDGPERVDMEDLAARLGIAPRVRFLGLRLDIADLLSAADVFVLPSHHEGLGIVGIEAQAVGLPCVFSTGVPAEVDVAGGSIFVDTNASPREWAEAILQAWAKGRSDNVEEIRKAGYDASLSAKDLERFYLVREREGSVTDSRRQLRRRARDSTV